MMVAASATNNLLSVFLVGLIGSTAVVHAAPCTLCRDGSEPTMPKKLVQVPGYPEIDCKSLDALIPQLLSDESSEQCGLVHQLSTLCGCPRSAGTCDLCPDGSPIGYPDTDVEPYSALFGGITPNCEVVEAYLHSFDKQDELCSFSQGSVAESCGCVVPEIDDLLNATGYASDFEGEIPSDLIDLDSLDISTASGIISGSPFFGAETIEQIEIQYRVSLSASILSLIGCTIVLLDCLWSKQRRNNLYNQIIAAMAGFDIVYGIAIAFGTLPMSADDYFDSPGEAGNEATCKVQGFFIQWGAMTSIFLNASLSTYFVLVIVYGTRESRFRQLRKWMIGLPILVGTTLASASVPFIKNGIIGCHLVPPVTSFGVPPEVLEVIGISHSWAAFLGCMFIPAFLSIAYSTGALIRVYFHMRQVDKNSVRWRFKSGKEAKAVGSKRTRQTALARLRKEVFWQSATYLLALYLTWFLYLSLGVYPKRYILCHYGLWTFLFFVSPLQGFLNSICYFRPRVSRYWRVYWIGVRKRRQEHSHNVNSKGSECTDNESSSLQRWGKIGAVEPAADLVGANEAATAGQSSDSDGKHDDSHDVEGRAMTRNSGNECHQSTSSLTVDRNTPPQLGNADILVV